MRGDVLGRRRLGRAGCAVCWRSVCLAAVEGAGSARGARSRVRRRAGGIRGIVWRKKKEGFGVTAVTGRFLMRSHVFESSALHLVPQTLPQNALQR